MKILLLCMCVMMFLLPCGVTQAFTLTFDDMPADQGLLYYSDQYGILFDGLTVSDHSLSSWGPPHSGSNVLSSNSADRSKFVLKSLGSGELLASSMSAYFSTPNDAVFTLEFYRHPTDYVPITSVQLGAPGESWSDHFVTVTPDTPFCQVVVRPLGYDGPFEYCIDDLTLTLVPEPAGLVALGMGAVPLAGMLVRRRRQG